MSLASCAAVGAVDVEAAQAGFAALTQSAQSAITAVEVNGLSIAKPLTPEQHRALDTATTGTTIEVMLSRPHDYILEWDKGASRLISFTDDKQTDLRQGIADADSTSADSELDSIWPGPTRHRCSVVFKTPGVPAPGAHEVYLKAQLALRCGLAPRVARYPNLPLKPGARLRAGKGTVTITAFGPKTLSDGHAYGEKVMLSLSPGMIIHQIRFFDSTGKSIETDLDTLDAQKMGYTLKKRLNRATIEIVYFKRATTVPVTVDVRAGLGL